MQIKLIDNTLHIELAQDEVGAIDKNYLIECLEDEEVVLPDFAVVKLLNLLMNNPKVEINLDDLTKDKKAKSSKSTEEVDDEDDLNYVDKEEEDNSYQETDNEGNTSANTVGNWLAQFVANGYKIQKAQVIRGQVVEELEFKGDLLIRKQHLCGPQITLLKMIVDEMSSTSSGCSGRVINSIDSFEEENTIYTKLLIEGNITLRYKLVRLETFSNNLKF